MWETITSTKFFDELGDPVPRFDFNKNTYIRSSSLKKQLNSIFGCALKAVYAKKDQDIGNLSTSQSVYVINNNNKIHELWISEWGGIKEVR